ncbi:hypothetical protein WJX73_006384 [Symbiochloris irregularis]|uniref:Magnesium transporter MgtE intracellular domain-containing protein n=2 Tax=Symbiochloris irregularis TaxID=706552 RepID=A0AAW1NQ78_9CHLO
MATRQHPTAYGPLAAARLRASPKDTSAELVRLLNTPFGQNPGLSELLPALKAKDSPANLLQRDVKLKELIGTAKLAAAEQTLAAADPRGADEAEQTRGRSRTRATVTASPQKQGVALNTAAIRTSDYGSPSLTLGNQIVQALAASGSHPVHHPGIDKDLAWLESVLSLHTNAIEVSLPGSGDRDEPRRAIVLRLPRAATGHTGMWPADVTDWHGGSCLLVLPASKPSARADAQALQALIKDLVAHPELAAQRAMEWRQQRLRECCGPSLATLTESRQFPVTWSLALDAGNDNAPVLKAQRLMRNRSSSGTRATAEHQLQAAAGQAPAAPSNLGGYEAWCAGGFLAAMAAAMADAILQVEVHCPERARALASIWNLLIAASNVTVGELEVRARKLEEEAAPFQIQVLTLENKLKASERLCDLLQRDALRQKQAKDKASTIIPTTHPLNVQLQFREAQMERAEKHARKRVAAMRWQWAYQNIRSGRFENRRQKKHVLEDVDDTLVRAMNDLEDMAAATAELRAPRNSQSGQQPALKSRLGKTAKDFSLGRVLCANPDEAYHMLEKLNPEARAIILMGLSTEERMKLLGSFPEDDLAATLACLQHERRDVLMEELRDINSHTADCAFDTMRYTPHLAARYLATIPAHEGRAELKAYDAALRMHVLQAMLPRDAAMLLEGIQEEVRSHMLAELPHELAATLIASMGRGLAIEVLKEMGNPKALECLLAMGYTDAFRLLQHASEEDILTLAQDLRPDQIEQLSQQLSPLAASRLHLALNPPPPPVEQPEEASPQVPQEDPAAAEAQRRAEAIKAASLKAAQRGSARLAKQRETKAKKPLGSTLSQSQAEDAQTAAELGDTTKSAQEELNFADVGSLLAMLGGLPEQGAELKKLPASVLQQAIQALTAAAGSRKLGIAIPAEAGAQKSSPEMTSRKASVKSGDTPPRTPGSPGKSRTLAKMKSSKKMSTKASDRPRSPSPPMSPTRRGRSFKHEESISENVQEAAVSPVEAMAEISFALDQPEAENSGASVMSWKLSEPLVIEGRRVSGVESTANPGGTVTQFEGFPSTQTAEELQQRQAEEQQSQSRARSISPGAVRRLSRNTESIRSRSASRSPSISRIGRATRDSGSFADAELLAAQAGKAVPVGVARDARLAVVAATSSGARVRTLGWALSVVEGVYTDFEAAAARCGGLQLACLPLLGTGAASVTMADATFGYLGNKYGSRALVDEYVGSLINTLAAWQLTEVRLAIFARLLTEQWPAPIAAAYLTARGFLARPLSQGICIEYPPEGSKPSTWVCMTKAEAAVEAALGARSKAATDSFLEHLRGSCVQATAEDLQYLNLVGSRAEPGTTFWKLPRDTFLVALCNEAELGAHAPPAASSLSPDGLEQLSAIFEALGQSSSEGGEAFVTAEQFARVAAGSQAIRSYLLLHCAPPPPAASPPAEGSQDEASPSDQGVLSQQDEVVRRHMEAMRPTWQMLIAGAPATWHGRLTSLVERLASDEPGVHRMELYSSLMQSFAAMGIQGLLNQPDSSAGAEQSGGQELADERAALRAAEVSRQGEQQLARVEQAILALHGGGSVRQEMTLMGRVT